MLKPAPRWGAGMIRRGRTPKIPYWDYRSKQILDRLVKANYITSEVAENQRPYTLRWEQGRYLNRNNHTSKPTTP